MTICNAALVSRQPFVHPGSQWRKRALEQNQPLPIERSSSTAAARFRARRPCCSTVVRTPGRRAWQPSLAARCAGHPRTMLFNGLTMSPEANGHGPGRASVRHGVSGPQVGRHHGATLVVQKEGRCSPTDTCRSPRYHRHPCGMRTGPAGASALAWRESACDTNRASHLMTIARTLTRTPLAHHHRQRFNRPDNRRHPPKRPRIASYGRSSSAGVRYCTLGT